MTKKNTIIRRLVNIEYLVVKDINDADHARLSGAKTRFTFLSQKN